MLFSGGHPFDLTGEATDDEVANNIKRDPRPPMDPAYTGHLSESAIDLIKKLMEPDPAKRITAYDLLHHPWVQGETATTEKMEDSDKKLSKFQDLRHNLESSIFAVLVNQGHQELTLSEAKPVRKMKTEGSRIGSVPIMKLVFDVFDEGGKGYVSGRDIGRLVSEHTGQKLNSADTDAFLQTQGGEKGVSLSDFQKLFSGLKHKHFPRGHIIFRAGDTGESMYFLSSGKVEIQTRKGQLVSILRSGDFFGEGSLMEEEGKRFTTAKCATPVDVIKIKRADFDRYTKASHETKNELKRKWRARNLQYAKNLLRLQTNVSVRTLKKGDVIYKEGDVGTSMFRVADTDGGELQVSHSGNPVHKYVPGDSFGESSILFDKPRS